VVGALGLEPRTSALSERRSSQLSYAPGTACARSLPARIGAASVTLAHKRNEARGPLGSRASQAKYARHEPTFPTVVSIIGPRGLTAEFGMGSGVAPWVWAPGKEMGRGNLARDLRRSRGFEALAGLAPLARKDNRRFFSVFLDPGTPSRAPERRKSGQADRPVSTGPLSALPRVHVRPIDLVVFEGPDGED
jgi:hypothetical protein